ncbi:hypothetical protein O3M35_009990 [Rhynocoris fuscipes]|uniref:Uncharacterized protein n=1 Tax=Rhynocoris fuscipes TaxID=488301 RepID=A0AAW1CH04_9HEMI
MILLKCWNILLVIIVLFYCFTATIQKEIKKEVVEEPVIKKLLTNVYHIIDVPLRPCLENQKRDRFGKCRSIFGKS